MSQVSGRGDPTPVPTFERSGTRDMASTPQPTPTLIASAAMRPAIRWTACCAEPHWASRVRQPAWYGRPGVQPRGPGDVVRLLARLRHAAARDLLDRRGLEAGPVEQRGLRGAEDLGGVQAR